MELEADHQNGIRSRLNFPLQLLEKKDIDDVTEQPCSTTSVVTATTTAITTTTTSDNNDLHLVESRPSSPP